MAATRREGKRVFCSVADRQLLDSLALPYRLCCPPE